MQTPSNSKVKPVRADLIEVGMSTAISMWVYTVDRCGTYTGKLMWDVYRNINVGFIQKKFNMEYFVLIQAGLKTQLTNIVCLYSIQLTVT